MRLFGGFSQKFWEEYYEKVLKEQPVREYDDRVQLYTLYHVLNHYAMFGGGYKSQAVRMMEELWEKYGKEIEEE